MLSKVVNCLFILLPYLVCGQTTNELKLSQFYDVVRKHHPIARQAELLIDRGKYSVSQARGTFDPKIVSDFNRKDFEGKTYYDVWNSYITMPTFLNIDFKAGYERNSGVYLNQQNTLPDNGLYYAGISVPLGQGLIYSQQNIQLKKSKYEKEIFENESNNVLNNLYLDANYAYWWWFENYNKRQVVASNLALIQERYSGVQQAVVNGAEAAIDSVEMLIQVQQWSNNLRNAELSLQNSLLLLDNFIWSDSLDYELMVPERNYQHELVSIDSCLEWALKNHPDLKKLSFEISMLDLDRKLSSESLKPIFDVNYNFLLENQNNNPGNFQSENYKLGAKFIFPLLLRKERAKLKIVKVKQRDYNYKLDLKSRQLLNKISKSYNKVFTLKELMNQQVAMQANYEKMLNAEKSKFDNGESSIFLLNSRENKKLNGEIKLIEYRSKYHRSLAELKWATGMLYQSDK